MNILSGRWHGFTVLVLLITYLSWQLLTFPRLPISEWHEIFAEACLAATILVLIVLLLRRPALPHTHRWMLYGFYVLLFASVTDLLDEFVRQPYFVTTYFEDMFQVLGYAMLAIGVWQWQAASYLLAKERGAVVERQRIARDLHDDVAPQLLTMIHSVESKENRERARAAMQTLRESIYMLSDPHDLPLETIFAEWRIEAAERAEVAGVELSWQQPQEVPELSLTLRQRLNLGRVLREAISNALCHANPSIFKITVEVSKYRLLMRLNHNGHITQPEAWRPGKGLNNMRMRIAELSGHIEWHLLPPPANELTIAWDIPFNE